MMLATDLDGTFLGGDPDNRQRLYQLINARAGSSGATVVRPSHPAA